MKGGVLPAPESDGLYLTDIGRLGIIVSGMEHVMSVVGDLLPSERKFLENAKIEIEKMQDRRRHI